MAGIRCSSTLEHSGSHSHGNEIASIEGMKGHGFMLRFEGNHDEQFAQMKNAIIDIHQIVRGNGKPGLTSDFDELCSRFDQFMVQMRTRDEERDRYRKQRAQAEEERYKHDKSQIARIGLLLTICLVLLGCITAYITVREARMHSLFPTAMIHSQQNAQAVVPYLERNYYAH